MSANGAVSGKEKHSQAVKAPDINGQLEGKFAIPLAQMITHLNKLLEDEYLAWLAYTSYGQSVKGPYRDAVISHFEEHAKSEEGHAKKLATTITSLGGKPSTKVPPPYPCEDLGVMVTTLIRYEQEALKKYRDTLPLCGENEGLKQVIETIIEDEQEHVTDLWLMVPRSPNRFEMMSPDKSHSTLNDQMLKAIGASLGPIPPDLTRYSLMCFDNFIHHLGRYLYATQNPFAVQVYEDDPERAVFEVYTPVAEVKEPLCYVIQFKQANEYKCSCDAFKSYGACTHVSYVKDWNVSGRKLHPILLDTGNALQRFKDSLKYKGKIKPKSPGKRNISPKLMRRGESNTG